MSVLVIQYKVACTLSKVSVRHRGIEPPCHFWIPRAKLRVNIELMILLFN